MRIKTMNANKKLFGLRTLIITIAIAALLLGGVSITGAAAQSAIPGDALYPVKTTIEQTRLSMASDAGDRAQMKMGYAEQRLKEIGALIEEGRYREVNEAVLAFEADINSAILELETVAKADPARAARLAMEITSALTRYAQTLSTLLASAPENVRSEVNRALDSTHLAGSLDLPSGSDNANDNSNDNANDNGDDNGNDNANDNGDDNANDNANANDNGNDNGDDNGNDNDNVNANDNGDDNGNDNANDNGDNNGNANDNVNANDYGNANDNGDDNGNANDNVNANDNGDDRGNDNANDNGDDNGNDNANDNGDDNSGSGGSDDNANDNDDNNSGKGGGGGGDDDSSGKSGKDD